jgi:hypothetical protein
MLYSLEWKMLCTQLHLHHNRLGIPVNNSNFQLSYCSVLFFPSNYNDVFYEEGKNLFRTGGKKNIFPSHSCNKKIYWLWIFNDFSSLFGFCFLFTSSKGFLLDFYLGQCQMNCLYVVPGRKSFTICRMCDFSPNLTRFQLQGKLLRPRRSFAIVVVFHVVLPIHREH